MNAARRELRTGQSAVIGGWVCLGVGFGLQLASGFLFLLYGPIYLAAFILGIVALAQSRPAHGVALLLLSLFAPLFGMAAAIGSATYKEATSQPRAEPAIARTVSDSAAPPATAARSAATMTIISFICEASKADITVRNTGEAVEYPKAYVTFKDAAGHRLGTSDNFLAPTSIPSGSVASATIYAPSGVKSASCSLEALQDRRGQPIAVTRI
jgi:hypothetical protein